MERLHHIGKRIMLARLEREMQQTELADAISVTQKTVSSWETGKSEIGALDLTRLSEVLGKPVEYFFVPLDLPHTISEQRAKYSTGGAGHKTHSPPKKAAGGKRKAA